MIQDEFRQLLRQHDWWFEMSDDHRAYSKGKAERDTLLTLCRANPEFYRDYNFAMPTLMGGAMNEFPVVANTATTENHKPNTQHTMKEMLSIVFVVLIQPLVEAIRENTAAVLGKASTPAADNKEAAAPDKPKGKKAEKEKPAATDDDGLGEETPKLTIDDVKAYIATIKEDDEKKAKFRGWMTTKAALDGKSGFESVGVIPAECYDRVIKALIKIGATDSRVKAAASDSDLD